MDYIPCSGKKCQLMLLLTNQFNKRTDFWIISITWLWLFPKLNLCSFDIFDKKAFCFSGFKSIVFFFLATVLIITMFNFQFWVRIKIGSWYYLTYCSFFNVLLNKWNCFRTVELHVFQLIVTLFHLTALTDLILYYIKNCGNLSKVVGSPLSIQITQFCGNLSKVVGKTSQPPFLFLKEVEW